MSLINFQAGEINPEICFWLMLRIYSSIQNIFMFKAALLFISARKSELSWLLQTLASSLTTCRREPASGSVSITESESRVVSSVETENISLCFEQKLSRR
ncbi:hypothetical protein ILYODFUR_029863 [Ilyodon furcidens]|uniref:Uncharacterized protein n=1 Tax=Ilyodon furcidens TaxID=33524 RepID=A0ABV0TC59_9TELE